MHPSHVELIVAIADAGSLGAAAKRIGKTQPAVTKALKRAEEDVGVQLFHRGAHGAHMTSDGARVVERCRRILRDLDALDEDLAQRRGELTGQIGVVVSPLAAMKIIPPVMARFASRFRGVRVQIRGGHAPKAFAALHSAEADFVIGPGPASGGEPGLIAEPLLQTGLALLTGGTSRYALTTDPQILGEAPWAAIGPRGRRPYYADFLEANGIAARKPVLLSDSILSILSVLEGSDLVCSFPSLVVPEILSRWNVVKVPVDMGAIGVDIAITRARGRILTPAAMAFADLVHEESRRLLTHNPK